MPIEIQSTRSPELLAAVKAGMRRHSETCLPWEEYADLTVVAHAEDGRLMGAALGETARGWLHISILWVDELFRQRRLGTQLLIVMEAEAIRRGCRSAYLSTFSYQASPFYEKHGYEIFGTLEGYPPGQQRFFMRKTLEPLTSGN